jgi:hypothetical protein
MSVQQPYFQLLYWAVIMPKLPRSQLIAIKDIIKHPGNAYEIIWQHAPQDNWDYIYTKEALMEIYVDAVKNNPDSAVKIMTAVLGGAKEDAQNE